MRENALFVGRRAAFKVCVSNVLLCPGGAWLAGRAVRVRRPSTGGLAGPLTRFARRCGTQVQYWTAPHPFVLPLLSFCLPPVGVPSHANETPNPAILKGQQSALASRRPGVACALRGPIWLLCLCMRPSYLASLGRAGFRPSGSSLPARDRRGVSRSFMLQQQ